LNICVWIKFAQPSQPTRMADGRHSSGTHRVFSGEGRQPGGLSWDPRSERAYARKPRTDEPFFSEAFIKSFAELSYRKATVSP